MTNFLKENENIYNLTLKDPNNEEIYKHLYDIISALLTARKCCRCAYDKEVISYTIAGDIYLKIVNGAQFKHVTNYINKVYKRYLAQYYSPMEIIDTDEVERQLISSTYLPSTSEDIDDLLVHIYLSDLIKVINQIIYEGPFLSSSQIISNYKISLMLSLLHNKIILFNIPENYYGYVQMAVVNFYEKLKEDMVV